MPTRKRSDGIWVCVAAGWMVLSGCQFVQDVAPPIEEVLDPGRLQYEQTALAGTSLERRMEEIERSYAEPRSPEKVEYSLETCSFSISPENDYAALHCGARACVWLAENATSRAAKERWALKGVSWGKAAVDKAQTQAESYYYLGRSLALLLEARGMNSKRNVRDARGHLSMARNLKPDLDHCGPDRYLGRLIIRTREYPTLQAGSVAEGINRLERAARECPTYGENLVDLAEGLIAIEDFERAHQVLDALQELPSPPGHTADHQAWLVRASELRIELPGL